jgi:hypothetical protein
MHRIADDINEPGTRERDLICQRHTLKTCRILAGKPLGKATLLRKLAAQQ